MQNTPPEEPQVAADFARLAALAQAREERRAQKRQEKFDRSYNTAYAKMTAFLEDPEQVERYNQQVAHLIGKNPGVAREAAAYFITPERTASFKNQVFGRSVDTGKDIDNAHCLSKRGATKGTYDITISIGRNYLDRRDEIVNTKTLIHELTHAYHVPATYQACHRFFPEPEQMALDHIEELLCDTVADVAVPWPLYGDHRVQGDLKLAKEMIEALTIAKENQIRAVEVGEADAEEVRQVLMDADSSIRHFQISPISDIAGETHPSNKTFFEHSHRVANALAPSRMDDYLDRIYGAHAPQPDHAHLPPPVAWRDLVPADDTPPAFTASRGAAMDVQFHAEPAGCLGKFIQAAGRMCQKIDDFCEAHLLSAGLTGDRRQAFKNNAYGMTAIVGAVATAALTAEGTLGHRLLSAGVAVGLAGGTLGRNMVKALKAPGAAS